MNKKNSPSPTVAPRLESETPRRRILPAKPVLRFTPTAWAKLLYLRDVGPVEVGGFAITPADNLLLELVDLAHQVTQGWYNHGPTLIQLLQGFDLADQVGQQAAELSS